MALWQNLWVGSLGKRRSRWKNPKAGLFRGACRRRPRGLRHRTPVSERFHARMFCSTLKELERRIGLRRDATRAPIQGPEWQGAGLQSTPQELNHKIPPVLRLIAAKDVWTMGSTLPWQRRIADLQRAGLICS